MTGHEAGESCSPGASFIGVVGQAEGHQKGSEVGITQTKLTELATILTNLFSRVVGPTNQNFLRSEYRFNGVLVSLNIEGSILIEVFQQVDRSQVAG